MRYRGTFKLELVRKLVHIGVGVLLVLLVQAGLLTIAVLGLLILILAALVLFNWRYEKELLSKILAINRADARLPGLDILFYFIGCWIVLAIFPRDIAFASILILAFGDSIAHLVSRRYGGTSTFITTTTYMEGTIAGIIAATLAAWLYVPFLAALCASMVAMFIEAGELRIGDHYVDDNLLIPLSAGVTLWALNYVLPFWF